MAYLLRGYGYRPQGRAVIECTFRYPHQGGGQNHTHQIRVSYKPTRWIKEGFQIIYIQTNIQATRALSGQGAYYRMHILRGRWLSWEKQSKKQKIEQHINISFISNDRVYVKQFTLHAHTYILSVFGMFVFVRKVRVTLLKGVASLLNGYGYRPQGKAVCEGPVRYLHQGGGQEHTHQINIIYKPKRWIKEKWEKASKSNTYIQPTHYQVRVLTYKCSESEESYGPERNRTRKR